MSVVRAQKLSDMGMEIPQNATFDSWVNAGSTWASQAPSDHVRIVRDYMEHVGFYEDDPSLPMWEEHGYGVEPYQRVRQSLTWLREDEQNPITRSETFERFWQLFKQVTAEEMRSNNGFDYSFVLGAFLAVARSDDA